MPAVGVFTNWFKHNLYGGAYGGKQNYFVNLRNGLSQSTYHQIITYFLGQSSVYTDSMNLSEWHIYGSSRIGIYQTSINMAYRNIRIVNGVTTQETTTTVTLPSYTLFAVERGSKRYELTNHLGNVLAVVSDKKIQVCTSTAISYYIADLVSATDYSPFGAPLAGRTYTAPNISYRFGFNGKEKDDETQTQDYGFRIYNNRLGRFLSVDPLTRSFPWYTPYQFAGNTPICAIDIDGLEDRIVTIRPVKLNDGTIIQKVNIYYISDNKKANTTTDGELNEYSKRIDSRFSALGTEGIEYRIYNEQGILVSSERVCEYKQGSPEAIAMSKTITYKEKGISKTGTRDQAMGNDIGSGSTLKKVSIESVDVATYPNGDGTAQINTNGLAYVLNQLNNQPTFKVTLTGYTDKDAMISYITPSDPDGNKKLSLERANDIKNTLINNGVSSDRITTYGAGSSQANQTVKDPKDRKVTAILPAKAN